jgi:Mg2+/Co2+ transporter CorC
MENFQTEYDNENLDKQFSEKDDYEMIPILDINDYNAEFAYEDFDTMNGMSYLNYLRFHDDMM